MPIITPTDWDRFLLPLGIAFVFTLVLHLVFRQGRYRSLQGLSIGCGFIAAYFAIFGSFAWPPATPPDYLITVALFAMLVGATLDQMTIHLYMRRGIILAIPLIISFWMASGETLFTRQGQIFLTMMMVFFGVMIFNRLEETRKDSFSSPVAVLFAAAGLTVIAELYGTRLALFASALAASLLGYLLAQFMRKSGPWGFSGILVAGGLYLGLAAKFFFMRSQLALPVAMTALPFFVPWILQFFPAAQGRWYPAYLIAGELAALAAIILVAGYYI